MRNKADTVCALIKNPHLFCIHIWNIFPGESKQHIFGTLFHLSKSMYRLLKLHFSMNDKCNYISLAIKVVLIKCKYLTMIKIHLKETL